jgi:hypothetical protein
LVLLQYRAQPEEEELARFHERLEGYIKAVLEVWDKDLTNTDTVTGDLGRLWLLLHRVSERAEGEVLRHASEYDAYQRDTPPRWGLLAPDKPAFLKNYSPTLLNFKDYGLPRAASYEFLNRLANSRDMLCPVDIQFIMNCQFADSAQAGESSLHLRLLAKIERFAEYFATIKEHQDNHSLRA